MKRTLFFTLCLVACGTPATAQTYSLSQLKDSALHHNIAIRSARHDLAAAAQQR